MAECKKSKWAVVTSDHVRHRFVANMLCRRSDVVVVVSEPKTRDPSKYFETPNEGYLLARYFGDREHCERTMLADGARWDLEKEQPLIKVPNGDINNPRLVAGLVDRGVTHCLVFGASWLKEPWFEAFDGCMVNIHLGLSPYYRGSGTNFWPLHDGYPEYVGATVHVLDRGLDSGAILFHVRPDPNEHDTAHDLGNKTISKVARATFERLDWMARSDGVPQWGLDVSKFFKSRDFDVAALERMQARFATGMMCEYVENLAERAGAVTLVNEYCPVTRTVL
jgi:hypothetical protein